MLNKNNAKLYRTLRGDYRKYARQLKNTLFDCCSETAAINDSLSDVFGMLAAAQAAGRAFGEVIPEPQTSIRETALCFPARKIRRNSVVILLLSAALVLIAGGMIAVWLTSAVWLAPPLPQFDSENFTVYWQPVEHAEAYEITVNDEKVGRTEETAFSLDRDRWEGERLTIIVTATGSGRFRDSYGSIDYTPPAEPLGSFRERLEQDALFENGTTAEFSWPVGQYASIRLEFTPEVNLCVRVMGDLIGLYEGTLETKEDDLSDPVPTDDFLILQKNVTYLIVLDPGESYPLCTLAIALADPLAAAEAQLPLPAGMTLFGSRSVFDYEDAIAKTASDFRFAWLDALSDLSSALSWMDGFCLSHLGKDEGGHFWLIDNLSEERPLVLEDRLQTLDVTTERKRIDVPSGWSSYQFTIGHDAAAGVVADNGYLMLYADKEDDLALRRADSSGAVPLEFHTSAAGPLAAFDFLVQLPDVDEPPRSVTFSLFNPSEQAVPLLYDLMQEVTVTEETLAQGTLTLQPGITAIENRTDALLIASTAQAFYAQESVLLHQSWYLHLHLQDVPSMTRFAWQDDAYFFNPCKEPLTLTIAAYRPASAADG